MDIVHSSTSAAELPEELLLLIFAHFTRDLPQLLAFALVCPWWQSVLNKSNLLWKHVYFETFKHIRACLTIYHDRPTKPNFIWRAVCFDRSLQKQIEYNSFFLYIILVWDACSRESVVIVC